MPNFFKNSHKKVGQPPGVLMYTGKYPEEITKATLMGYGEHSFEEREITTFEEIIPSFDKHATLWINIDGLQDLALIEKICTHFKVHPLTREDILHPEQRPKAEDSEEYMYVVLKMMHYEEKKGLGHADDPALWLFRQI